ncbi:MAG: ATP-binding cassette domain-containing protein [Alphaproteobacteria bacterium]|nr:ATP-binding cassette domain-containing protein [Alphaproteobacteria bacterium]
MSLSILVENLQKNFRIRKKSGLFKSVFSPEYFDVRAVDGVSFSLKEGERVAFVGPNGAGKSTTIKILSGILHPDGGRVEIGGFVPWVDRKSLAYRIGTVFGQRSQLWYHLPAQDTFELLSYAYDMSREDYLSRIKMLVDAFDAGDIVSKPVRQLSLGERMRCEIIASLLHRPKILFLDEPTVGLDVVSKGVIRDLVKKASDEDGTTVLLTSHDTGDMERVCDRVIVIDHGQLVTDKPVRELRSGYIREKIITLAMKEEAISLTMNGVRLIEAVPHQLRVSVDTSQISVEAVLQAAMKLSSLQDITVEDPPMEDIIKEIYAGSFV